MGELDDLGVREGDERVADAERRPEDDEAKAGIGKRGVLSAGSTGDLMSRNSSHVDPGVPRPSSLSKYILSAAVYALEGSYLRPRWCMFFWVTLDGGDTESAFDLFSSISPLAGEDLDLRLPVDRRLALADAIVRLTRRESGFAGAK